MRVVQVLGRVGYAIAAGVALIYLAVGGYVLGEELGWIDSGADASRWDDHRPAPLRIEEVAIAVRPGEDLDRALRLSGGSGHGDYVGQVVRGPLPEGLELADGSELRLIGTARGMGWSTVRIRVTDIGTIPFMSATKTLVIRVQD